MTQLASLTTPEVVLLSRQRTTNLWSLYLISSLQLVIKLLKTKNYNDSDLNLLIMMVRHTLYRFFMMMILGLNDVSYVGVYLIFFLKQKSSVCNLKEKKHNKPLNLSTFRNLPQQKMSCHKLLQIKRYLHLRVGIHILLAFTQRMSR